MFQTSLIQTFQPDIFEAVAQNKKIGKNIGGLKLIKYHTYCDFYPRCSIHY